MARSLFGNLGLAFLVENQGIEMEDVLSFDSLTTMELTTRPESNPRKRGVVMPNPHMMVNE